MGVFRGREDAFGHALMDHLMGRETLPVMLERNDGLVDTEFVPGYFTEFRRWSSLERSAMRSVQGRVLDVGCGAGRVALHLQRRGHAVVGIDVSALAVKVCALRGVEVVRAMPVTQVDGRLGAFDTIVMMGNNLGLLASRERAGWLLRRFHRLTTERGRIIATSLDAARTMNPDHLSYQRTNRRRGRMPGQVRLRARYRTLATPWFDYLFMSPDELEAITQGTGWHVARLLMGDGPEYVALLEKGE
jgi:SAM-dependent methyltransferase